MALTLTHHAKQAGNQEKSLFPQEDSADQCDLRLFSQTEQIGWSGGSFALYTFLTNRLIPLFNLRNMLPRHIVAQNTVEPVRMLNRFVESMSTAGK